MKLSIHAHTDLGLGREVNEDSFAYCPDLQQGTWYKSFDDTLTLSAPDTTRHADSEHPFTPLAPLGAMLIVADGMGGTRAGQKASRMAIQTVQRLCTPQILQPLITAPEANVHDLLIHVVEQASQDIRKYASTHPDTLGMGTTIVLAWLLPKDEADSIIHLSWCGDSRAYTYHPQQGLHRITTDHSYVQQLCSSGQITEEEMLTHPDSNLLTRCVGDTDFPSKADCSTQTIPNGTMLMLCTDGLSGYTYPDDIERTIRRGYCSSDPSLIDLALQVEAQDNITTLCATLIRDNQKRPAISFLTRLKHLLQ